MPLEQIAPAKLSTTFWAWAILGRGSSAAYFADTLSKADNERVVAIGQADPWSAAADLLPSGIGRGYTGERNDPLRFVNHAHILIAHPNEGVPKFSADNIDRRQWAKLNDEVIRKNVNLVVDREIAEVKYGVAPNFNNKPCFVITLTNKEVVYADRVLFALGAGASRYPDDVLEFSGSVSREMCPQLLDVNSFGRGQFGAQLNKSMAERLQGKRVAVIGPNAALDAAFRSLFYSAVVNVFVEDGGTDAVPLDSQPLVKDNIDNIKVKYVKSTKLSAKPIAISHQKNGTLLLTYFIEQKVLNAFLGEGYFVPESGGVTFCNGENAFKQFVDSQKGKPLKFYRKITRTYDYVVYGIGMDGSTVDKIASELLKEMEPVLDSNRLFGDETASILGYKCKKGMIALGAVTNQFIRKQNKKLNFAQLEADLIEQHQLLQDAFVKISSSFATPPGNISNHLKSSLTQIKNIGHKVLVQEVDRLVKYYVDPIKEKADPEKNQKISVIKNLGEVIKKYNFIGQATPDAKTLFNNVTNTLGPTVADIGQLSSGVATVQAANNFMPFKQDFQSTQQNNAYSVANGKLAIKSPPIKVNQNFGQNKALNFYTANRDQIQVFAMMNYPNITSECVESFSAGVEDCRKFWGIRQDKTPRLLNLLKQMDEAPTDDARYSYIASFPWAAEG